MGCCGGTQQQQAPPAAGTTAPPPAPASAPRTMYVGGYTKNIYQCAVAKDGGITVVAEHEAGEGGPSFLALSKSGAHLYATLEGDNACAAFSVDKATGTLKKLNQQPTKGLYPCHIIVAGEHVICANYGGGNVTVFPIAADGSLGEASCVQQHTVDDAAAKAQAAALFKACKGFGTDEDAIYECLGSVKDQDEWFTAQRTFATECADYHGGDLLGVLKGELSGKEQQKCTEVMQKNGVECWVPAPKRSEYVAGRQGPAGEGVCNQHAHQVCLSPDGKYVFSMDLGIDTVFQWVLEGGQLVPNPAGARVVGAYGSGPRHMAFDPSGETAYVINELDNSILHLKYNAADGTLTKAGTAPTLPAGDNQFSAVPPPTQAGDFDGTVNCCADIHFHPSGKFAYGSNRGHDSIAVYGVAADGTPRLTGNVATGGFTPRNFCVDPSGALVFVANQNAGATDDQKGGGHVATFSVDAATGALKPTGAVTKMKWPSCIVIA